MKKLLLLAISSLSFVALAKKSYTVIAECWFDFDFCSKHSIAKYNAALAKQSPNYDATKTVSMLIEMRMIMSKCAISWKKTKDLNMVKRLDGLIFQNH
ncbi:hypothetical protein [Acinetobacter sp. NIPH 2699]|uniref:hypothetical protein n=1 Tax=Acinetobacter sp. NIPH 2699 TaxID=2923433 RepID=UPI001F4B9D6C|nr:hypothetical protein [Acinetobacter sp. NIPH 2699]MCH7335786.1 hypothetical protein [Acinetobacter sp. NIPH 2699]